MEKCRNLKKNLARQTKQDAGGNFPASCRPVHEGRPDIPEASFSALRIKDEIMKGTNPHGNKQ